MPRPIYEIAADVRRTWPKVNYAAKPYLDAMRDLDSIDDKYIMDDARDIVLRFIGNAGAWRGDDARRIKAELRAMLAAR
jgi:hypothetical protein